MPAPKVAGTIRSKNPLKGAVEVLPERLYYAALKSPPPSHNILASTPKRNIAVGGGGKPDPSGTTKKDKKQIHFFNMDNELVYWNFFLDFGPLNLGQLVRFCNKLNEKLRKFPVVCFYSNTVPAKRANAIFLMSAWQILYLNRTPEQAFYGFLPPGTMMEEDNGGSSSTQQPQQSPPLGEGVKDCSWPPVSEAQGAATVQPLPPFHDASPVACTYDLNILDCLRGMVQARTHGFFNLDTFNLEEYEHYEQVENGDLNWIADGKIMAFAGPSYERHVSPEGYCTLAPADYIPYFQKRKVDLVIRLNKKNYNEEDFVKAGIRHGEYFFLDGSCPSMKILGQVLEAFESVPPGKAFAVHCKAGLGRTGTCIGAYLMKHYRFTAAEVIGWMRICRPGCVIGPQQHFLQQIETRMWQAGDYKNVPRSLPASASSSQNGHHPGLKTSSEIMEEAIRGRNGQGASLLAARGRRSKAEIKAAIPTPPITPEQAERQKATAEMLTSPAAVVTPGGSAASSFS